MAHYIRNPERQAEKGSKSKKGESPPAAEKGVCARSRVCGYCSMPFAQAAPRFNASMFKGINFAFFPENIS